MAVNLGRDLLVDAWRGLSHAVLPARCLLCGGRGESGRDLCAECRADVPRNHRCCGRCGVPMPESAALCGGCQKKPPPWTSAWAPFVYGWPLDRLETRFKFAANLACGRVLAELWAESEPPRPLPAWIVPVPLHPARLRRRGYNQALELARPLAHALRVPCKQDVITRQRPTGAQTELDAAARRRNVRGAFAVAEAIEWPDHVALLDDVMTTGATLAECSRVLLKSGVARVDVWALARAPTPNS